MATKVISKEIVEDLIVFVAEELEGNMVEGVTYALLFDSGRDLEKYNKYLNIRKKLNENGFDSSEVFRIFKVSNGYILDLDLDIAKKLALEAVRRAHEKTGGQFPFEDFIKNNPEIRRAKDLQVLGKYILSNVRKGITAMNVALFSRNRVGQVVITPDGSDGSVKIKYPAFVIRHWDINQLNLEVLEGTGYAVFKIVPHEILSSKTGVKFTLYVGSVPSA